MNNVSDLFQKLKNRRQYGTGVIKSNTNIIFPVVNYKINEAIDETEWND